jgi:site-specific recombinase XerD
MKLENRERVDGTQVTIGRRVHCRNGRTKASRRYVAEYRDSDGRQRSRSLGTTSKAQARRMAIEIQQEIERGVQPVQDTTATVAELADSYHEMVQAKGAAQKTVWKYRADLNKLKAFCRDTGVSMARHFGEADLYSYRNWLTDQGYADKTVQGAIVVAKQVFKWAWRRGMLRTYALAGATFPKAKSAPQPCFTSEQVDQLIEVAVGEERAAFALMGYAGLRIGEVEQLRWEDVHMQGGRAVMLHICRGGSNGTTKDRDDRFVPAHPIVTRQLAELRAGRGKIFREICERRLLKRLKDLCEDRGFETPRSFKLHSFRHHFASLCANNRVAHRKALAWLGHSSSNMLDLYYHLHDEDSLATMQALAMASETDQGSASPGGSFEGNLRAMGQSTIEKMTQAPEITGLVEALSNVTERVGFEPTGP